MSLTMEEVTNIFYKIGIDPNIGTMYDKYLWYCSHNNESINFELLQYIVDNDIRQFKLKSFIHSNLRLQIVDMNDLKLFIENNLQQFEMLSETLYYLLDHNMYRKKFNVEIAKILIDLGAELPINVIELRDYFGERNVDLSFFDEVIEYSIQYEEEMVYSVMAGKHNVNLKWIN